MDRTDYPAVPDRDLVELIQRDPHGSPALKALLDRWLPILERRLSGFPPDDVEDILSAVSVGIWEGLQQGFEYRGDKAFRGWLFTILRNASVNQSRFIDKLWGKAESLNEQIEWKDGSTRELGDTIPSDLDEDSTDRDQREQVVRLAEQRLRNPQHRELLRRRVLGEPLPKEWSRSWIDTTWHRITRILLADP
jgi:DNA-directed RNA polymerase specialized sigma24 family protein